MLHLVLQDQRVQKMIKVDQSIVTGFKDLAKSMATQANGTSVYLLKIIALLVILEEKALLHDNNRNLIAFMPQLKSHVITLLNDGFAGGIKIANTNVIGTLHKAYPQVF